MCVSLACFLIHHASGQIDGQTGSSRGNSLLCRSVALKMSGLVVIFFLKAYQLLRKGVAPKSWDLGSKKNLCQSNVEEAVIWEHSTAIAIWVMIGRDLRHLHFDVLGSRVTANKALKS